MTKQEKKNYMIFTTGSSGIPLTEVAEEEAIEKAKKMKKKYHDVRLVEMHPQLGGIQIDLENGNTIRGFCPKG